MTSSWSCCPAPGRAAVTAVRERVRDAILRPADLGDGIRVTVGVSIGVAVRLVGVSIGVAVRLVGVSIGVAVRLAGVSIGVAVRLAGVEAGLKALTADADAAMYREKQARPAAWDRSIAMPYGGG